MGVLHGQIQFSNLQQCALHKLGLDRCTQSDIPSAQWQLLLWCHNLITPGTSVANHPADSFVEDGTQIS